MLTELHLRNFRLFEDLRLGGLKRVNLIAGKNNTGKTALLEALRILAAKGENTVVNHILKRRGEFTPSWPSSFDALFTRSMLSRSEKQALQINELVIERNPGIGDDVEYVVSVQSEQSLKTTGQKLYSNITPDHPRDQAIFIPLTSNGILLEPLWEKIVLTPLEDEVHRILRETVEPNLVRLDVKEKLTKVRLKNEPDPLPLQTLGDGIQRMLALALALVNAKGKVLLIDEFEAGLHHSIQEKLWELVFEYARKWNIQAFITTHSEDTLRTFYYVAARPENTGEASFQRLQFARNGKLEVIHYDIARLEAAMELNLEIR